MSKRPRLVTLAFAAAGLVLIATVALVVLVFATSAPELPPPQIVADANAQVRTLSKGDLDGAVLQTNLAYQSAGNPVRTNLACWTKGHWMLVVNPQDVIGHPYASLPTAQDWARGARVTASAQSICEAPVTLTWYGYDPKHPSSDVWTATMSASLAASMDGRTLRHYALHHARQM